MPLHPLVVFAARLLTCYCLDWLYRLVLFLIVVEEIDCFDLSSSLSCRKMLTLLTCFILTICRWKPQLFCNFHTFVTNFLCRDLRTFSANFGWQTDYANFFTLFKCMLACFCNSVFHHNLGGECGKYCALCVEPGGNDDIFCKLKWFSRGHLLQSNKKRHLRMTARWLFTISVYKSNREECLL